MVAGSLPEHPRRTGSAGGNTASIRSRRSFRGCARTVSRSLLKDVKRNGIREPVLVSGNLVVDARNRLRATAVAELPDEQVPVSYLPDNEDPTELIYRRNYLRRDLTPRAGP